MQKLFGRRSPWLLCGAASVFLLLGAFLLLPPGGVWITDNGNRYIMMRNFAENRSSILPHPCPELFPTGGFHFQKTPAGFRSFYPETLSFLTVPFYRLFGERGVLFWPIAGTLILLGLAACFFRAPPEWLLIATPLAFFSFTFWEMTPSAALAAAGLICAFRKRYFFCGLWWGLGLWMREELYILEGSAGLALLLCGQWKNALRLGAGFLLPSAGLWGFNYIDCGHILGFHGSTYYTNNQQDFSLLMQLKRSGENLFRHLLGFGLPGDRRQWLTFAALLLPAAGMAPRFRSWKKVKFAALLLYLGTVAMLTIRLWSAPVPVYAASGVTGVLISTPLIAGFLLHFRALLNSKNTRFWTITGGIYLIVTPLLLTTADVGLIFGPRHFLILLPLLWILSFRGWTLGGWLKKPWRYAMAASLILGVAVQIYGLYALSRVSADSMAGEKLIARYKEEIVVSDLFFLPEQTPRLFFTKTFLQVRNPEELALLKIWLAKEKKDSFVLVLSPTFRQISDAALGQMLREFPPVEVPVQFSPPGKFPELFTVRCRRNLR